MRAWIIAVAAVVAAPASANDSVAETRAGGLVLVKTTAIDMVSEDLFVSADQVRVRYVFRNRTPRPVRATIAFPMPDEDLSQPSESDVAYPSDFRTLIDGRPVDMRVERKAVQGGIDRSALLTSINVPVSNDDGERLGGIDPELDALTPAQQDRLIRLGLARVVAGEGGNRGGRRLTATWTVKETWYWDQVFPAGRDLVVEHLYKPGTGESMGTALAMADFRASAEGRRMIADYCVDSAFLAGLDRMAGRSGENAMIGERRIGYVLRTGANWAAPIRDFRLVVDKGAAENLISFCGSGIRKTGPTRFEMRRSNWRPDRDLELLILFPRRPEG